MNDFLKWLGEQKWTYYYYLFVVKPTAQTTEDCYNRVENKIKYEKTLEIIDRLPADKRYFVEERFNHLKNLS